MDLTKARGISGVPVVVGSQLVGIVPGRDLRFEIRYGPRPERQHPVLCELRSMEGRSLPDYLVKEVDACLLVRKLSDGRGYESTIKQSRGEPCARPSRIRGRK